MPRPRKELVDVSRTPYYHVTSRCVRRAYLCGSDKITGKSYEHRKHWIEERIRLLASVFAVDICAYAVMSNHYHIVLRINANEPSKLSDQEVIARWRCIYKGSPVIQKAAKGETIHLSEQAELRKMILIYRNRLSDLSWFMKALNEPIAKTANREDSCSGHFWESRFCSHALGSTAALIACMVYVDLNPYRAKLSRDPTRSAHTSIKQRIEPSFDLDRAVRNQKNTSSLRTFTVSLKSLQPFADSNIKDTDLPRPCLPFAYPDYLELLHWTAGRSCKDKRSSGNCDRPSLLTKLQLAPNHWLASSEYFDAFYRRRALRLSGSGLQPSAQEA